MPRGPRGPQAAGANVRGGLAFPAMPDDPRRRPLRWALALLLIDAAGALAALLAVRLLR